MLVKDYLGSENRRNREHAALYTDMVRHAYGDVQVIVGHHVTFEIGGNLETENEIPSADTLMFCHDLMHRIFGEEAVPIMCELASVPVEKRDNLLASFYAAAVGGKNG